MTPVALVANTCSWINRWRHTRGYGVHSPLAYRLVTECIRPNRHYRYYADDLIDTTLRKQPRAQRQARLLLRLQAQLPGERFLILGSDKCLKPLTKKLGLWSAAGHNRKTPPSVIVDFNRNGMRENIPQIGQPSLSLRGSDYEIFIWREGMQPVAYDIL